MKLQINGETVTFPSSLSEITLKQKIEFEKEHRPALIQIAKAMAKLEDPLFIEAEEVNYRFERMVREFSFFTGIPEEVLRKDEPGIIDIDQVSNIYYSCLATLQEDQQNIELNPEPENEFVFANEFWEITPPEDGQKFSSFLLAKKLTGYMITLSNGDWSAMLPICATYVRQKNELFNPKFLEDGFERMKLMENLPMDIVIHVMKFLNDTLNVFVPDYDGAVPLIKKLKS